MASIHRDPRSPKGVWYAAYRRADGRKVFRSTRTRDRARARIIAEAWEAAERAADLGQLTHDRVLEILNETLKRTGVASLGYVSVRDWLTEWLASKDGQITGASHQAYSQAVREFLFYLGERGSARRLESITTTDIEGYVRLLRDEGRSPSTINKLVRKYLSAPFEKARLAGKIPRNPVMATTPEKAVALAKDTFSGEQVAALLDVADNDWQGAILFAYGTGARLGDVATLRWSNLDVAAGIVVFREQKTKALATIGLHPDFLDWLVSQPVPEDPAAPVFPTLATKPHGGGHGLSRTFVRLIELAGIHNPLLKAGNTGKGHCVRALTFHSFRHTAASNVFAQASIKEITRRVTNHAAGGSINAYIHDDLEAIRAAVALIPRLPKGPR